MSPQPVAALMYDFDRTLSPKDMQEYAFIPKVGLEPSAFWEKCNARSKRHHMDPILAYMLCMKEEAEGKMLLTRDEFRKLGADVELFPGVDTWFQRVNVYGEALGLTVEHYILSSGLKEIIEGTPIAGCFQEIYAAEYCYNEKNVPIWPAMAVNYTSKTQFLFRINKGVLDTTEHNGLNEFTPEDKRRVPFRSMLYFGDGLTDVPCMKLVKEKGGHSIAVYGGQRDIADRMLRQGRVDYVLPADYSAGGKLERTVFAVLDQIRAADVTVSMHIAHLEESRRRSGEEGSARS